tara:strand:- start:135 stop:449 length:315 start_codon:yes stop_codon:yes gene_type:complete
LANTLLFEGLAGEVVTGVISFHVYDVAENRFHPLTTTIDNFERAVCGDRAVRIKEWGFGDVDGQVAGVWAAMNRVLLAGGQECCSSGMMRTGMGVGVFGRCVSR